MHIPVYRLALFGKFSVLEYRPVVAVESGGDAVFGQDLPRHFVIALKRFLFVEIKPHDHARGVVDRAVQRGLRMLRPEPVVDRRVDLEQLSEALFPRPRRMLRSFPFRSVLFRRREAGRRKDSVKRPVSDRYPLVLVQLLEEMREVEPGAFPGIELDYPFLGLAVGLPFPAFASVPVLEGGGPSLPVGFLEAVDVLPAYAQLCRRVPGCDFALCCFFDDRFDVFAVQFLHTVDLPIEY